MEFGTIGSNKLDANLLNDNYTRFPLKRIHLGIIFLLALSIFIISALLGNSGNIIFRYIFFIFGPILVFISIISILMTLYYDYLVNDDSLIELISFGMTSGIIVIVFAITLNDHVIYAALTFLSNFIAFSNPQEILILLFGVFGPLNEELAKLVPLLVLSRGIYTYWGKSERRIFNNYQMIIFFSFIIGGLFVLLETYWYLFNLTYLYSLYLNNIWDVAFSQILIRSLSPLHIITTSIMGLGIGRSLYLSNHNRLSFKDYSPFFLTYIVAVAIHGIWNGTLVYSQLYGNLKVVNLFGTYIPLLNVIYGIIIFIFLIILMTIFYNYESIKCDYCNNWHQPPFNRESHIYDFVPKSKFSIFGFLRRNNGKCNFCGNNNFVDGLCQNCHASKVFICNNCKSMVPAHETICWNCKIELKSAYEQILNYKTDTFSTFSVGLLKIQISVFTASGLLALSYYLWNNKINLDTKFIDAILVRTLFLFMLGLSSAIGLIWISKPKTNSMGIAIARIQSSIIILELAYTLFILGNLFYSSFLVFLLYLIEAVILFYIGFKLLIGYKPIFHGGISTE